MSTIPDYNWNTQHCWTKEWRSIVRGESVYLTMLSGHNRHTHSVSVPNISVLLHTHVEAVLKFEVVSHFAHFWSYFSTNFHIWPTKSKLRASFTTWRCFRNVLVPVRGEKRQKTPSSAIFITFLPFFTPLQAPKHYKNISMLYRRLSASIWWVICENWLRNGFRNEQNVRQLQNLTLLTL